LGYEGRKGGKEEGLGREGKGRKKYKKNGENGGRQ
jgi:hypothetical protein